MGKCSGKYSCSPPQLPPLWLWYMVPKNVSTKQREMQQSREEDGKEGTTNGRSSHGGTEGSWGQQKLHCVPVSPSISCWSHVSVWLGDRFPGAQTTPPLTLKICPFSPPRPVCMCLLAWGKASEHRLNPPPPAKHWGPYSLPQRVYHLSGKYKHSPWWPGEYSGNHSYGRERKWWKGQSFPPVAVKNK